MGCEWLLSRVNPEPSYDTTRSPRLKGSGIKRQPQILESQAPQSHSAASLRKTTAGAPRIQQANQSDRSLVVARLEYSVCVCVCVSPKAPEGSVFGVGVWKHLSNGTVEIWRERIVSYRSY